jgi:spore germination cell wall hydrolase CwlJ-like protein
MNLPDASKTVEEQDEDVLAVINIWSEGRGEGPEACQAIMHTVLNRVALQGYMGKTIKEVILHPWAFSWVKDNVCRERALSPLTHDKPSVWDMCAAAYSAAMGGSVDPTNGSTHYYSMDLKEAPAWATARGTIFKGVIGNFKFYKAS